MRNEVLLGDARDMLATLPDACCDALVSDPPAGVSFMGKDWDGHKGGRDQWIAWLAGIMAEARRCLRPGGYAFIWALPRTSHWTATALENSGFEIRQVYTHLFATGFPKSLNVSRDLLALPWCPCPVGTGAGAVGAGVMDEALAADCSAHAAAEHGGAALGATTGVELDPAVLAGFGRHGSIIRSLVAENKVSVCVGCGNPRRPSWVREGLGTAEKPAAEHWILARNPLAEPTVAANVLAHGTGALHIDACRVAAAELAGVVWTRGGNQRGASLRTNTSGVHQPVPAHAAGRWPPNTLFSHVGGPDGCQPAGVRRVRGSNVPGPAARGPGYHRGSIVKQPATTYADAEGYETVDAWTCHPQCPIRLLDAQAGPRPSGGRPGAQYDWAGEQRSYTPGKRSGVCTADTGSASRFFPCFGPDPEEDVRSTPCKASPALGAARQEPASGQCLMTPSMPDPQDAVPFRYQPKAPASERSLPDGTRHRHPTTKPLALMDWLVRLVTPEGGVVLDPFCGSGSTLVAAAQQGFGFIGIDAEAEYVETARARLAAAMAQPPLPALTRGAGGL